MTIPRSPSQEALCCWAWNPRLWARSLPHTEAARGQLRRASARESPLFVWVGCSATPANFVNKSKHNVRCLEDASDFAIPACKSEGCISPPDRPSSCWNAKRAGSQKERRGGIPARASGRPELTGGEDAKGSLCGPSPFLDTPLTPTFSPNFLQLSVSPAA